MAAMCSVGVIEKDQGVHRGQAPAKGTSPFSPHVQRVTNGAEFYLENKLF